MDATNFKLTCVECDWRGHSTEQLRADNPFDPGEFIYGCPKCKSVDCFLRACDEAGCWSDVTCGTPTPNGYRNTCGKHRPEPEEE